MQKQTGRSCPRALPYRGRRGEEGWAACWCCCCINIVNNNNRKTGRALQQGGGGGCGHGRRARSVPLFPPVGLAQLFVAHVFHNFVRISAKNLLTHLSRAAFFSILFTLLFLHFLTYVQRIRRRHARFSHSFPILPPAAPPLHVACLVPLSRCACGKCNATAKEAQIVFLCLYNQMRA